jgi:RHS repeat-associated protein
VADRSPGGGSSMLRFHVTSTLAACLVLCIAGPGFAFEHPQVDRGFDPDKLFQYGEVDQVSLRDGKVSIVIPIGQEYRLSERFSYRFLLSASGSPWDFVDSAIPVPNVAAVPNRSSNAGWNWSLYLAQLRAPGDPGGVDTWRFIGPDGGEEELVYSTLHACEVAGTCGTENDPSSEFTYSRSGGYTRMYAPAASPNYREVHVRNGTVYEFAKSGAKWRLSRIRDPFLSGGQPQNWVEIDYTSEAPDWVITDSVGRTHRVIFTNRPYDGASVPMVDEVELAAFQETTATYDFRYYGETGLGEPADSPQRRDIRHTAGDPETTFTAARLSSVVLPDSTRWTFRYYNDAVGGLYRRGQISELGYPTHGKIRYDYFRQSMPGGEPCPSDDWLLNWDLLLSERVVDEDGVVNASDGTYTYVYELSNYDYPNPFPEECASDPSWPKEELLVRVITPNKDRIENYFSVWSHQFASPSGFQRVEFGLPLTRGLIAGNEPVDGKYLSSRTLDCDAAGTSCKTVKADYVLYEYDANPTGLQLLGRAIQQNRRLKASRTVYFEAEPDDPAPTPAVTQKYASVTYDVYDGVGNYRERTLGGDFGRGDVHETWTNYNPARGVFPGSYTPFPVSSPWILDTYTFVEETGGDSTDTARRDYGFDAATGFLRTIRTYKSGTTPSNQDLYALFCPVASGAGAGSVQNEYYVGGDGSFQLPNPLPVCNTLPGSSTGRYRIDHTLLHGVRATSQYQGMPAANQYLSLNLTIDQNTGLPSASTDPAGVVTTFLYDAMGRTTEIRPGSGEEAWTALRYPDTGTNLYAETFRCAPSVGYGGCTGGTYLAADYVGFDGLGRVEEEARKLPGSGTGWSTRLRTYDAMGHPLTISSWARGNESHPVTTYSGYDAFGRPGTVTLPDGKSTTYLYQGIRWTKVKQNVAQALSGTETCVARWEGYDRQGRLWRVDENPPSCNFSDNGNASSRTRYSFDEAGRTVEVCQELDAGTCGQTRSFLFDNRGFLTSETHPEKGGTSANGTVSYFDYDSRGHAWEKWDGGSARTLQFTFDKAERLTLVEDGSGNDLKQFVYDTAATRGKGRLHQAIRWNAMGAPVSGSFRVTETYEYLGLGGRPSKRTTQTAVDGVNAERWELSATYDLLGGYATLTSPRCFAASCTDGSGTPARTRSFAYSNGFLSGITQGANPWASIEYATNQTVSKVTHGNGTEERIGLDTSNRMARPSRIELYDASNALLWDTGTYQYDAAGNVKAIGTDQYRYDRYLRLVEGKLNTHSPVQSQLYGFDNVGNLTSMTTTVGAQTPIVESFPVQDTNPNAPYRPTNRLAAGSYDLAGNLTKWSTYAYGYDLLNAQTSYCPNENSQGVCLGEKWLYAYTADDERILSVRTDSQQTIWTVRDFDGRLLTRDERVASGTLFGPPVSSLWTCPGGTPSTRVFCDGFESGNTTEWSDTSQGVARRVTYYVWRGGALVGAETIGDIPRHFALDHLGTVRRITNDIGEVVAEHDYFPFGREATTPSSSIEPMKFTGHERDSLSTPLNPNDDQEYLHARFRSPLTGRFLSTDRAPGQASVPRSWNRYSYALGNPQKFVDPDGNAAFGVLVLAAVEIGATTYDGYQTQKVLRDPTATRRQKAVTVGLFLVGLATVGGGYTSLADNAVALADDAARLAWRAGHSSRRLGRNLLASNVERLPGTHAHHIVAADKRAGPAQDVLRKFGIGINEAPNGVFLPGKGSAAPGAYHPSLHTDAYYDMVNDRLKDLTTREEVIAELQAIAKELAQATAAQ